MKKETGEMKNQMMGWIWRSLTEENGPTNLEKKKKDKQLNNYKKELSQR